MNDGTNMAQRYEREIPEGYEARIEGNKVIIELKETESEDERIRKELIKFISDIKRISENGRETWAVRKSDADMCAAFLSYLEKLKEQKPILEVFGFKVGDAVKLKDGDGRKHIIKSFEEVEGLHGPNFYHVEFEDNSARDGIYPGEEYPNGYYTQMEKIEKEQKPLTVEDVVEQSKRFGREVEVLHKDDPQPVDEPFEEWIDGWYNEYHRNGYITMDEREFKNFCRGIRNMYQQKPAESISKKEYVKRFKALCDAYEIKLPNREYDIYHLCDDLSKLFIDSDKQKSAEKQKEQKPISFNIPFNPDDYEVVMEGNAISLKRKEQKPAECSEDTAPVRFEEENGEKYPIVDYKLMERKSWEWSEEDETHRDFILETLEDQIRFCKKDAEGAHYAKQIRTAQNWLKSRSPFWKPSEEQMGTLERWLLDNEFKGDSRYVYPIFESLYNDLKKLM